MFVVGGGQILLSLFDFNMLKKGWKQLLLKSFLITKSIYKTCSHLYL